jgi:hypothetical protein
MKRPATLQISFPLGQTLALALLILALMSAALEIAARLPQVESRVPTAIGSGHPELDTKFGDLDYLHDKYGRIDCLFIGSSVVNTGIDPATVEQVFQQQTGIPITCYNFGINGVTAANTATLAGLLIDRYHPHLLVYGFTLRAFGTYVDHDARRLMNTPWIAYQLGDFDLKGWLIDHSAAFRRYLAARDWPEYGWQHPIGDRGDPTGFMPYTFQVATFDLPPELADFTFSDQQLAGLDQILALRDRTQLIVLEVPAPPTTRDTFKGGPDGHRAAIQQIAAVAEAKGVSVWLTSDRDLIPANGWIGDVEHLNRRGAAFFSQWLGAQLADAFANGEIRPVPVK